MASEILAAKYRRHMQYGYNYIAFKVMRLHSQPHSLKSQVPSNNSSLTDGVSESFDVGNGADEDAEEDALIKNSICSIPETRKGDAAAAAAAVGDFELVGDELKIVREETQQNREFKHQNHSYGFSELNGEVKTFCGREVVQ